MLLVLLLPPVNDQDGKNHQNKEAANPKAGMLPEKGVLGKVYDGGDLKASRENPDKTIAVFKNDELFQKEFERLNKEIAEAKVAQEAE